MLFRSRFVPDGEIRVGEGVFTRDALLGVEREELAEQVQSQRVRGREELHEGHSRLVGKGADVVLRLWIVVSQVLLRGKMQRTDPGRTDAAEGAVRGRAEEVEHDVELVDVVLALEDWPTTEQLGEHASDAPDVD